MASRKYRSTPNRSILNTSSNFLSPNEVTTKHNLDSLIEHIKNDKEYSQYKIIKQKINYINKTSIITKQIDFELSKTPLQFKPYSKQKQHQQQQLYNKSDFLKLRQKLIHTKRPRDQCLIKEQDLQSSGSYDSDYFDLDDTYSGLFDKKIESIKTLKYPSYLEDKIKEDVGSLTLLLTKIYN